jgi:glycosyltransferase involved in cell wall biosynthesis
MVGLYRRNSQVLSWIDRLPLRFANAVVGNCNAITAEAMAVDGIDSSRAFTVCNGVDTHLFHEGVEPSLRHELGFTDRDVVFGVIANFDATKGQIDLIRAAHQLQARSKAAKFLMVGADKGQLAFLQSEIRRLGMEQRFVIRPRASEPERLLRVIDVYASTSVTEGMSNSVLEAMASGKPVIATAVGGNPELVMPLRNGFLVPPNSPEGIAVCIEKLCCDAGLRAAMGVNGRRIAEQQFSTAAMVRASEDLYLNLLSTAKPLAVAARDGETANISFSRY